MHAPAGQATGLRRTAAEHYLKSGRDEKGLAVLRDVLDAGPHPLPRIARSGHRLDGLARSASARLVAYSRGARAASPRRACSPQPPCADRRSVLRRQRPLASRSAPRRRLRSSSAEARAGGGRARPPRTQPSRSLPATPLPGAKRAGAAPRSWSASRSESPRSSTIRMDTRWPSSCAGMVHFFLGEWRSALAKLDEADAILRTRCRAVAWELAHTEVWSCNALDPERRAPRGGACASRRRSTPLDSRDDLFASMHLTYPACVSHIVADDVDARGGWPCTRSNASEQGFTAAEFGVFISACSVERYRGDGKAAWARVERASPLIDGSDLMRVAVMRAFSAYERGLSAIASATQGSRSGTSSSRRGPLRQDARTRARPLCAADGLPGARGRARCPRRRHAGH